MAPDLFELLGVRAWGRGFEMVIWAIVVVAGAALIWRERVAGRDVREGLFGWLIGGVLVGFGLWRWASVAFLGELFFGPRGLVMPTYGVLMAVGFTVGTALAFREAERTPGPPTGFGVLDLSFWLLIGSMLGARILFMLTRVDHYVNLCTEDGDCFAFLRIWEGGLVFYGGVLGAWAAGAIWCRLRGVNPFRAADLYAAPLALAHAIGRVGCYAASCCFGARTEAGYGVHYPEWSSPFNAHMRQATPAEREVLLETMHSHAVLPVQLWEALGELAIFFVLVVLILPRKRYHGQVIIAWAGLYAMLRFSLEMVRDDAVRGYVVEIPWPWMAGVLGFEASRPLLLTTSQGIALGMVGAALALHVFFLRRRRGAAEAAVRHWRAEVETEEGSAPGQAGAAGADSAPGADSAARSGSDEA